MRAMLRGMSARQWFDWLAYMRLAPFGEERQDIRTARICQFIVNMQRDVKAHPDPFPLKDFLLLFGDAAEKETPTPPVTAPTQTPDEIERIVRDWVAGSAAIQAQQGGARG